MDVSEVKGLLPQQVTEKHKKFGYNELPSKERKNIFKIIIGLLMEPMIFLLLATVAIYFVLGDAGEASLLLISVAVIIGIELYQEAKTERSLEALRNLSSPIADVIRDGKRLTIPGRELVVGDIMLLAEGSRVPADAKLLSAVNLAIDESLLTGESMPVDKHTQKVADYRINSAFSGTLVVKGHAMAEVTAIGQDTELGGIGKSLKSIETEKTLLQKEVTKVVQIIAVIAITIAAVLAVAFWQLRHDLLHGILAGLTASIALLPEEFPVVLTLFLVLGAWRLAKNNVLTRKAHTIETLGSASVLCVDKTGTLTQNKMQVMAITNHAGKLQTTIPKNSEVIQYSVLASQKKPFDPMEEAFIAAGQSSFGDVNTIYDNLIVLKEYPLEGSSLSVAHAWGKPNDPQLVAIKGAPETVFDLCRLSAATQGKLELTVKQMARDGLRVLAVARAQAPQKLPNDRKDFDFTFLGLVGLADPVRPEVPQAIKTCRQAGIRVIMITGDHPETAAHIGRSIGFEGKVVTGAEFEALSDAGRRDIIKNVSIFSRVTPEHKLTIVKALKENGEIVAMTGDGVNDAPALKAAHIGIAMGKKGTDVAREAATIVLLDDDFSSIVHGVRLGRRIYDNLQKAMTYIFAVHVPIATLSLAPVFFDWPLILIPVHVVFLEFVIDPSSTIIFENEKEDRAIMERPPRKLGQSIFSRKVVLASLMQGVLIAVIVVGMYAVLVNMGWAYDKARAFTFLALIIANMCLTIGISGKRALDDIVHGENKAMIAVLSGTAIALVVVYAIPFMRELFHFDALSGAEIATSIILGVMSIAGMLPLRFLAKRLAH